MIVIKLSTFFLLKMTLDFIFTVAYLGVKTSNLCSNFQEFTMELLWDSEHEQNIQNL